MPDTARNDLTIYDAAAARWWSDDIRWVRTLRNMVPGRLRWFDRLVAWPDARVLDLGCAGGFMAEALDARGARVTGIDPSAPAVAAARAHAREAGRDIRYDIGVGEDLPYPADSFDIVVCVDVLEHVADLDRVLAEIARVLTPGGVFLYDTINRTAVARLAVVTVAEDILRILPRGTHDPALFITPRRLERGLRDVGLEPGDSRGLGPRGLDRRLDLTFGPLPGRFVLYMGVARKPPTGGSSA